MMELAVKMIRDATDKPLIMAVKSGVEYKLRRMAGGLYWPGGGRPGFLVIVGEEADQDWELGGRAYRVLGEAAEFGGEPFLAVEPMLETMIAWRRQYGVVDWFGPDCPLEDVLIRFNRKLAERKLPVMRIRGLDDADYGKMLELVYRRTVVRKLLHFGDSTLPGRLAALPADAGQSGKFQDDPEVSSLLFAVAGLEGGAERVSPGKRKTVVVDKVAGY